MQTWPLSPFLAYRCCKENTSGWKKLLCHESKFYFRAYFSMLNRDKSSFANLVPRYFSLVNLNMRKGPLHVYMEMEQAINNNIFIKLLFSLACRLFFTQVWQTYKQFYFIISLFSPLKDGTRNKLFSSLFFRFFFSFNGHQNAK